MCNLSGHAMVTPSELAARYKDWIEFFDAVLQDILQRDPAQFFPGGSGRLPLAIDHCRRQKSFYERLLSQLVA